MKSQIASNSKYKITIYHGGEMPEETLYAQTLEEAQRKSMRGEYSEIIDLTTNKMVYGHGGDIAKSNLDMVKSYSKEFIHHGEELQKVLKNDPEVEGWVVAKGERATTDLSDITHYLDGTSEYAKGGKITTNSKQVREAIKQHILENVYDENEEQFKTLDGATQYLAEEFKRVANHRNNLARYPNNQERFTDYLRGIPFNFYFYNDDIEDFLNGLGINPSGKKYTPDQMWKLYGALIWKEVSPKYSRYGQGGEVGSYNNPQNSIHVLHVDGQNWFLSKIDSTHFYISNDANVKGSAQHIGQHNGEPYYEEIRQWLKSSKFAEGGEVSKWSVSDITDAEYLGIIEIQDNQGEYHNFEIMETNDKLVFGSFTNSGFIESGYIEKEDYDTDQTLVHLIDELEVYYDEGIEYCAFIVVNQRMARGGQVDKGGMIYALAEFVSSGTIANKTNYEKYDDISTIRTKAIQYYIENGDKPYSMGELERVLKMVSIEKFAEGGEVGEFVQIGKFRRNILGTLSFELKLKKMRKAQDFSVYPAQEKTDYITIQSQTRFGKIEMTTGRGLMSQSHTNGAYSYHFQMDRKEKFQLTNEQLSELKKELAKTAGKEVGNMGVISDNTYADQFAKGGNVEGLQTEIHNLKRKLVAQAKSKGISENFGQKEVRMLEEKYPMNYSVGQFDEWVQNFDLDSYAKGGKLSNKATYIPKRDIAEVEVEKDGKTTYVDGANLYDGVYVKKGKFAKGGQAFLTIADLVQSALEENYDYPKDEADEITEYFYSHIQNMHNMGKSADEIADDVVRLLNERAENLKKKMKFDNDYVVVPWDSSEANKFAKGGMVTKGELVWKKLSSSDKIKFLHENFTPEITPRGQEILVGKSYNFLPKNVKQVLQSKYANVEEYAKGGKLSNKATYIPKRDIAEVEVEKDGKTTYVDGANLYDGVYVKKGKFAKGGEVDYFSKTKQDLNFLFEEGDVIKVNQIESNGKLSKVDATILEKYPAEQNDGSFYPFYFVQIDGLNNKSLYAQDKLVDNLATIEKLNLIAKKMYGKTYQELMNKGRVTNGVQGYAESEKSKKVFQEYLKKYAIESYSAKEKYAKGGKLSNKATYIPKRDIAEVEVEKDGKTTFVDGANLYDGVYVKKGKFAKGGSTKYLNNGEANGQYLDSLSQAKKKEILTNIAKHYEVSLEEANEEVRDSEAELLFEYIANNISLAMEIHRGMMIAVREYAQGGDVSEYPEYEKGINISKPFYVENDAGFMKSKEYRIISKLNNDTMAAFPISQYGSKTKKAALKRANAYYEHCKKAKTKEELEKLGRDFVFRWSFEKEGLVEPTKLQKKVIDVLLSDTDKNTENARLQLQDVVNLNFSAGYDLKDIIEDFNDQAAYILNRTKEDDKAKLKATIKKAEDVLRSSSNEYAKGGEVSTYKKANWRFW